MKQTLTICDGCGHQIPDPVVPPAAETAQFDKLKAALSLIENYDSSCECDDHTNPECCANVPVSDCFCAHCIAGKALLMTREEKAAMFIKESGKAVHSSDCATSIAPAEEPGPCDCAETAMTADQSDYLDNIDALTAQLDKLRPGTGAAINTLLRDAYDAGAAHVREAAQGEIMKDYAEDVEDFSDKLEAAERKLAELDKALQSALFPLAVLVQSGECVAAATALNEELKLQILTAHDDVYAALASLRAESKEPVD